MKLNRKNNQLKFYKNRLSNDAINASVDGEVRYFPELGACALQNPIHFKAYRFWLVLRHLEGNCCTGVMRLDTAKQRLWSLRKSENWARTIREAAQCGFVSVFRAKNGHVYLKRHGFATIISILQPSCIGRAIYMPVSEIIQSVPKAKRAARLAYAQKPKPKKALPQSQNKLAKSVSCHRSTLSRDLKARQVTTTRNYEVLSDGEGLAIQYFESGLAIDAAKALNQQWQQDNLPEDKRTNANIGPYCAIPAKCLPTQLRYKFLADSWVIIRRMPSTIQRSAYKAAPYALTVRICNEFSLQNDYALRASHLRDGCELNQWIRSDSGVFWIAGQPPAFSQGA